MISAHIDSITDAEGWRLHELEVGRLGHGILGVLHAIVEETVNLVKIDGEMTCL